MASTRKAAAKTPVRRRRQSPGVNRPDDALLLIKQDRALRLKLGGATYQQIADFRIDKNGAADPNGKPMWSDRANARKALLKYLEDHTAESAEQMRVLDGLRLERLLAAVWNDAIGGQLPAISQAQSLIAQRARLFGLNAPTKLEITDEIDREIQELAASLSTDGAWQITSADEAVPDA